MKQLVDRVHAWLRRLLALAVLSIAIVAIIPVPAFATAAPFIGSPPLPAHESVWILIDGGDPAAGTTTTLDAAERFASHVLKLQPGKSIFRFSPMNHDLGHVERSFGRSGTLGKMLIEVNPAVVVLMIEGKALPKGPGYGAAELTAEWIDKRISDLSTLCPSALVVVVAEPCAPGTRQKVEDAAMKRAKIGIAADKLVAPVYLIFDELASGRTSAAPLASVLKSIRRAHPTSHALGAELAKVFTGAPGDSVAIGGALFLAGLLGAANDTGGNGYDVVEIQQWMSSKYRDVIGTLDPSNTRHGELVIGEVWGDEGKVTASAYPLKRKKYLIGICVAFAKPLPTLANEGADAREDRTRVDLEGLARVLEQSARAALPQAPNALVIDVLDPSRLPAEPPTTPRTGPGACSATSARYLYDVWVELYHRDAGEYLLQASRVRTHEALDVSSAPPPDREKVSMLLVNLGERIVQPIAVYKPVSENEIAAAAAKRTEETPPTRPPIYAKADTLYQQGRNAFVQGDHNSALNFFKRSNEIQASPEALLGVAISEERLGRPHEERRDLQKLVQRYPSEHPLVLVAKQRLAALDRSAQAAPASQRPPTFWESHRVSLIGGGAAAALGIAGGALAARTYTDYTDLFASCGGSATGCSYSDKRAVQTEVMTTNVIFGAAGVAAAVAVVTYIIESAGDKPPSTNSGKLSRTTTLQLEF